MSTIFVELQKFLTNETESNGAEIHGGDAHYKSKTNITWTPTIEKFTFEGEDLEVEATTSTSSPRSPRIGKLMKEGESFSAVGTVHQQMDHEVNVCCLIS